jgi:hypothetical protein
VSGADRSSSNPFRDHVAVQEHAGAHDLEVAWEGSTTFRKWRRKLSPEQFEVHAVLRTHKGPTRVGLFSKELIRTEWRENQKRDAWRQRGGRR